MECPGSVKQRCGCAGSTMARRTPQRRAANSSVWMQVASGGNVEQTTPITKCTETTGIQFIFVHVEMSVQIDKPMDFEVQTNICQQKHVFGQTSMCHLRPGTAIYALVV